MAQDRLCMRKQPASASTFGRLPCSYTNDKNIDQSNQTTNLISYKRIYPSHCCITASNEMANILTLAQQSSLSQATMTCLARQSIVQMHRWHKPIGLYRCQYMYLRFRCSLRTMIGFSAHNDKLCSKNGFQQSSQRIHKSSPQQKANFAPLCWFLLLRKQ